MLAEVESVGRMRRVPRTVSSTLWQPQLQQTLMSLPSTHQLPSKKASKAREGYQVGGRGAGQVLDQGHQGGDDEDDALYMIYIARMIINVGLVGKVR